MKNSDTDVKRILVVEDEPAICQVCHRVLTSEGFEVCIANNGAEAEDKLRERHYDLILVDIRTPVMNGPELYQYIINQQGEMADRVIFTTGEVVDGYAKRFLELAGRPCLLKPFTPDELKTIVRETLRQIEK